MGTSTLDFERAIRTELPVLYRVAKRMSGHDFEAEDIVQETMIRAFKAWNRFDGRHLRAWLLKILYNENLAMRRGMTRDMQLSEYECDEPGVDELWSTMMSREQASTILRHLDQLEPHHRLVIQLCDVEGMSYEEVATVLGLPVGTVRSRLFRGRNVLRSRVVAEVGSFYE